VCSSRTPVGSSPDVRDDDPGTPLGNGRLSSEGETARRRRDLAKPAVGMQRLAGIADASPGRRRLREEWDPGEGIHAEREMTRVPREVFST